MSNVDIYSILSSKPHNKEHLDAYFNFIQECCQANKFLSEGTYTEKHHICPRSIWPEYKSLIQNPWNKAILTASQHFNAHLLLCSVFTEQEKYKMMKAMCRITQEPWESLRGITAEQYEIAQIKNSIAMRENNPMKNKESVKKMRKSCAEFYESEEGLKYRKLKSEMQKGICNITEDGLKRLSERWKGVKRPKKEGQVEKTIKSTSSGIFHTPFGDFYSPGQASRSEKNTKNFSRAQINKRCKEKLDGFDFTSFGKEEKRGKWTRS